MAKKATKKKPTNKKLEQLNETGRRKEEVPVPAERRKKQPRRRQIDPTTCERDYNDAEIEFMQAMDEYKRLSGRMFPTCSEILEVLVKMGYRKIAGAQELYNPNSDSQTETSEADLIEDVA